MAKTDLTAARLRELLDYNPETGVITSRCCTGKGGRFPQGSVVGWVSKKGYRVINVCGKPYKAHQLAWLFIYGEFCSSQIDHIDGDKSNNSASNLRKASQSENSQNQFKAKSNNKSGFLGVSQKRPGIFQARISIDGKTKSIGYFDSAELAYAAYLSAKKELHNFGELAKEFLSDAPEKRSFTSRSKSGVTGVHWNKRSNKWVARPTLNGKQKYLGYFDTAEDAINKCLEFVECAH